MDIQTLALTFLPPVFILSYIIKSDRFREPPRVLIASFILGYLICFPAGVLNNFFIDLFSNGENPENYAFIAGFVEETLKFSAIGLFLWDKIEFDEPMDAIVYGTTVSLGFATIENYGYVYLWSEDVSPFYIAALRSVSAIPLHACCGIIMGFFLGIYMKLWSKVYLILALLVPTIAHATYNYLENFYMVFVICLSLFTWYLHSLMKKKQRLNS